MVARARGKTLVGVAGVRGVAQHQEITRADARGDVGAAARGDAADDRSRTSSPRRGARRAPGVCPVSRRKLQRTAARGDSVVRRTPFARTSATGRRRRTRRRPTMRPQPRPRRRPRRFRSRSSKVRPARGRRTPCGVFSTSSTSCCTSGITNTCTAPSRSARRARAAATRRSPPPPPPPDGSRDSIAKTNPTPTRNPPR